MIVGGTTKEEEVGIEAKVEEEEEVQQISSESRWLKLLHFAYSMDWKTDRILKEKNKKSLIWAG